MTPVEKKRKCLQWTKRILLWATLEELALILQAVRSGSCDVLSQQLHSLGTGPIWIHRSCSAAQTQPHISSLGPVHLQFSVQELTEGQHWLTQKLMCQCKKEGGGGWERAGESGKCLGEWGGGRGGKAQECPPRRQILESFESFRKAS